MNTTTDGGDGVTGSETHPDDRAGLVTRTAASALDAVFLSLTIGGAAWLLEVGARAAHRFAPPIDLPAALVACAPLLVIAYHTACWRATGQTLGGWIMGIRVVALGGGQLGVPRCLLRLFGCLVSTLPFYLGFLWILGPQRRGWHDILAGTEVLYVARQVIVFSEPSKGSEPPAMGSDGRAVYALRAPSAPPAHRAVKSST